MTSHPDDLAVRPARQEDAAGIAPLLANVDFPMPVERIAARIDDLRKSGDHLQLVAVEGNVVVGVLTAHPTPVLHREEPVGRITLLSVAPDARGRGVGRLLVTMAERELVERGCRVIEVISNRRYEDAHGFYRRLGFEETSVKFKKVVRGDQGARSGSARR